MYAYREGIRSNGSPLSYAGPNPPGKNPEKNPHIICIQQVFRSRSRGAGLTGDTLPHKKRDTTPYRPGASRGFHLQQLCGERQKMSTCLLLMKASYGSTTLRLYGPTTRMSILYTVGLDYSIIETSLWQGQASPPLKLDRGYSPPNSNPNLYPKTTKLGSPGKGPPNDISTTLLYLMY